jgi:hypothetical protein
MSNMSYCRFQNTALDLADCKDALEEITDGIAAPLSLDEVRAAKRLASLAFDIVSLLAETAGIEFNELYDSDKLEDAIESANCGLPWCESWDHDAK